jgi:RHS repeat-associated protein
MTRNNPYGWPNAPYATTYEVVLYGLGGQRMATAQCNYQGNNQPHCWVGGNNNIYFAGKMVMSRGVIVATDRLGSVRANGNGERFAYYPYGEERTSTSDGREKFGTYTRDNPAQDYADQRYYNVGTGRFNVPDPSGTSAIASVPGSWNRYPYASNDPVNYNDRRGAAPCFVSGQDCTPTFEYGDGGIGDPCDPFNIARRNEELAFGAGLFGPVDIPGYGCYAPGGSGASSTGPAERTWKMYVVADRDCYRQFVGALGFVWERDIDYYAVKVFDDGAQPEVLSARIGDTSVIREQITNISGPDPMPDNGAEPGRPFEDRLSVAGGGAYKRLQTFTVTYQGITYNAMIKSLAGDVTSSNTIEATKNYVNINDKNIGKDGHYPICK